MKTVSIALGVLLAASICSPTLRAEEPVKFKPTWKVGNAYHQTQVIDMAMAIPGVGDQTTQMTIGMGVAVSEGTGENKVVTMTIDSLKMEVSMGETKMAYDSKDADAAAGSPLAAMGKMVGGKFEMIYDAEDNFVEVGEIPEFDGLGDANPFGSKDSVKNLIGESMRAAFPEDPIPVGHEWDREIEVDMAKMGKLKVGMHFNYEANETREGKKMAKVKFSGVFDGTVTSAGGAAAPGVEVKFGEGSRQEGEMYFDPKDGTVSYMEASATLNMDMGGKIIPVKQKIRQTLKLIE